MRLSVRTPCGQACRRQGPSSGAPGRVNSGAAALVAGSGSKSGLEGGRRPSNGVNLARSPSKVPVNTKAIGKSFAPTHYAVGREKIKEYSLAVGETNPVHLDVQAARDAGYSDVVAPPMFAVVYSAPAVGPALFDPEVELNFALMVHGGQEFEWGEVVVAGDEIETVASVKDIHERDGRGYYVFESLSTNQRGEQVCRGTWTNIVRGV